ncbi:hypothetical protein LCGC14_0543950 [marine sediment metagenome]|uniref:Uncharacterized protein n=1 Tax=marine sediment metagenome TaxID=412755 RepID=A0A0F9UDK2_9ZZZZ
MRYTDDDRSLYEQYAYPERTKSSQGKKYHLVDKIIFYILRGFSFVGCEDPFGRRHLFHKYDLRSNWTYLHTSHIDLLSTSHCVYCGRQRR